MMVVLLMYVYLFSNDTATTEIYTDGHTLSLHDALPVYLADGTVGQRDTEHLGHRERFRWKVEVRKWRLRPPPPLFRQGNRAARGAGVDRKSTRLNSSH